MRITELFTARSIALDIAAPDQAAILDKLVALQATHGNITDADAYKKALYAREAEASTYVDNGITVPHARAACVTRPSLAALRLSSPVQYNPDDEGKTDLLFAIAAPENGSLHIDMLARMMQMLMNEDFVAKLRAARTPAEFLDAIDAQEEAQFGEESFTQQEIPQNGYRVLAVTACPNGIAHTYMAAEALTKMGDKLGLPTKVETNGS
ncbi:MAG: PTS sugar transporter subunit IIA, partial [Oscillospiraceae bacterium]|nr:PTS sugar transporter subunit IIA [Oscillospiraceae bacterium]